MTRLVLIAAMGHGRAIGQEVNGVGTLPWHLPEDLRHFRTLTSGKPVIMGRKTWESLPAAFRPLPKRPNIVVTRNSAYVAPGAHLAHSVDAALAGCANAPEAFIIGGAELYRQAILQADALELTEIDVAVPAADAFFPTIDPATWLERHRTPQVSETGLRFAFVRYERRR